MSKVLTRDLISEEFADNPVVGLSGSTVTLSFESPEEAQRVRFLLENAIDLGLGIQFRPIRPKEKR